METKATNQKYTTHLEFAYRTKQLIWTVFDISRE